MHHSIRSARPAAALALAVAATLVTPGLASASTTTPTTGSVTSTTAPATTTAPTTSTTSTGSSTSSTGTGSTTSAPSTATAPTTTQPAPSTTASAPTTAPSTSSTTSGPATGGLVRGGDAARYGLAAPSALPATSTDPTLVGAGFLERELAAGGHHLSVSFDGVDYADYGVTLDAVLALDAAGAGQTEAAAATKFVADNIGQYIGTDFGPTELYAGATAKSLLVAVAQGVDPTAFGGVDLVSTLEGLETPSGRFSDHSAGGADYSNLIGQSLAVMSLRRAGETTSPASVTIIRDNQCSDGGFSLSFGATPCVSDPDVTAFAVQALLAVGGAGDADAGKGLDYLAGIQGTDGGVGGAGPTAAHNANSTGLAGQAFLAGGRTAQARAAQGYLRALQYGCDLPAAFRGGIAYDRAAMTAAAAKGATVQDQDRRATSQALLALAGTPLYAVSGTGADATAPDLTCAAPTTSTTTSPTSTTSTTSSGTSSATSSSTDAGSGSATAGSGGGSGGGSGDPASATPGSLAFTGADVSAFVIAGLLLLLLGAGALVLARRKGVHA
ncbi:hypothetical protein [Pedococcus soli]